MELKIGENVIHIEPNKVAKTADSSCLLRCGDTIVLTTVCRSYSEPEASQNFLPLTCNYMERRYAAGMIPGGFFKREGRPTEKETLTSRLMDRPARPLFPEGWTLPVQIISTVLSADKENDGDILAMLGTSFALRLSSIPYTKPFGTVKVGFINNNFILNPSMPQTEESSLNLTIAGTEEGIAMIEMEAKEVTEDNVIAAIKVAMAAINDILKFHEELPDGTRSWTAPVRTITEAKTEVLSEFGKQIEDALKIKERFPRGQKLNETYKQIVTKFSEKYPASELSEVFDLYQEEILRKQIIEHKTRIDGRGPTDIRQITCETGLLPRVHGSALFTRGETQSLCTVTLGTTIDEQRIEELTGETRKSFMLHYNFPPFSVGEVGRLNSPGRREIGHGALAEKSLQQVIPVAENCPYTIRIVSDILSSNGSSSMATVCGGSLALMDAGIPIKSHVAGVAIGAVEDTVLIDICGEEDHFGDMDFKVAGTKEGITALQLDVKNKGVSVDFLEKALKLGREARLTILDKLISALPTAKTEVSAYAPKISIIMIPKEKIGHVIGPGGKIIRDIIEKTGAKIEISDDGRVSISSDSWQTTNTAKAIVEGIVEEVAVGKTYLGKIKKILPFGVIVDLLPGKEGMIHISQLANYRVKTPEDEVKMGEEVPCKVISIDDDGRIQLSRKALLPQQN
ncbi:MAG: polyribonucleotide nucleotidyltransferase [bacterium]|nr:polyribonucleotide nucleotidyltransferase [bacterium]